MNHDFKEKADLYILISILLIMFLVRGNDFMNAQYLKLAFITVVFFMIPRIAYGINEKVQIFKKMNLENIKNFFSGFGTVCLIYILLFL